MGKLAICLPSMGRRASLEQFLKSYEKTTSGNSDILLLNVEDDPDLHAYDDVPPWVIRTILPNTGGYAQGCQKLVELFPQYSYYISLEDDCLLLNDRWDTTVVEQYDRAFPDKLGLGIIPDISGQIVVSMVSREWIDKIGWFFPNEVREHGVVALSTLAIEAKRFVHMQQVSVQHILTERDGYFNSSLETMHPEKRKIYEENDIRLAKWKEEELPRLLEVFR